MSQICFYFQVHQPDRLRPYRLFDIGRQHDYFDRDKNREICQKVTRKCYLPMNALLLDLIKQHEGRFKCAFSISGTALEQFQAYAPEVIESFQALHNTGSVEFLAETYHHSLAFLYSKDEFTEQVRLHGALMQRLFGAGPTVFRNTELIYSNEVAAAVQAMGFRGILAEGWEGFLDWRSPNFLYRPAGAEDIKVLLKNYRLSDDIAFRFGNRGWPEYPLSVAKYAQWLAAAGQDEQVINLFMDYETFGEHQWADTGIFEFMHALPAEVLRDPNAGFCTPSEAVKRFPAIGTVDVEDYVSWADVERDLSAWRGNSLQHSALQELYSLERAVKDSGDNDLLTDWRRLTTSDHAYYMCTKWFADGDVHKYFSPYESPYDAFIAFMNVLQDLKLRIADLQNKSRKAANWTFPDLATLYRLPVMGWV